MPFSAQTWPALSLSLQLAACTTLLLLLLATPLAWWLAQGSSRWRALVGAITTLPLVLPPSVLGFYLLLALGPQGPLGQFTLAMGWGLLSFSFSGLLLGSLLFSPFAWLAGSSLAISSKRPPNSVSWLLQRRARSMTRSS